MSKICTSLLLVLAFLVMAGCADLTIPDDWDTDLVLIGDSNTAISYFERTPQRRWSNIVAVELGWTVVNLGRDGRTAEWFLETNQLKAVADYNAQYYLICLGLNDCKYYSAEQFEQKIKTLVGLLTANTSGQVILMTNVAVDYPDHHSFDRNTCTTEYDNALRRTAAALNLPLIDIYYRFERENTAGNWDTRIRTTNVWDASQDSGQTVESGWFDDVHYNVTGNAIVAEEVIKFFERFPHH